MHVVASSFHSSPPSSLHKAELVKMMDPSVALKKVRQMLTEDLQALLELQSMFNVALHEQAGGLDTGSPTSPFVPTINCCSFPYHPYNASSPTIPN